MSRKFSSDHAAGLMLSTAVMLAALAGASVAQDKPEQASTPPDPSVLRICAAVNEQPYSNKDG